MFEVLPIELRNDRIHPFPTHFAAAEYDFGIVRGDHDGRKTTDVIADAIVHFVVAPHDFADASFDGTADRFLFTVPDEPTAHQQVRGLVRNVLGVGSVKVTLCVTEVMDGIEDVRLATSVVSDDAVDAFGPNDFRVRVVAEIQELNPSQLHVANFPNFAVAFAEPSSRTFR
jgi:hypothetical protein